MLNKIKDKFKKITDSATSNISVENCMLDLEEASKYLEDKDFLSDPSNVEYFKREMIKLYPECYETIHPNISFFKMKNEATMEIGKEPYVFHDDTPYNSAKKLFDILNEIKQDDSSYWKVSPLRNMIYVKHMDELYATQFASVCGVYMTAEGFIQVPGE